MYGMAFGQIRKCHRKKHQLYRVFYYDCPPIEKRVENPISKRGVSLQKSDEAVFRKAYFEELKQLRKLILRLGHLFFMMYSP
jgi:hypothetical protein